LLRRLEKRKNKRWQNLQQQTTKSPLLELSQEADDLETTAFGQSWRSRIGGLNNASITLNFMQDFAAGSVDATLNPLLGSIATVVIQSASGTVSEHSANGKGSK
jgi:hypothetical protein